MNYIDQTNPQIGGSLKVHTKEWNFSQLFTTSYIQYGYFTDDKLVFGNFNNRYFSFLLYSEDLSHKHNLIANEVLNPSISSSNLVLRHSYEIVGGILQYKLEFNPNLIDQYHEDVSSANEDNTIEGELVPTLPLSMTERFFIQLGRNK